MSNAKTNKTVEIFCITVEANAAEIIACERGEDCDCGGRHERPANPERYMIEISTNGSQRNYVSIGFDKAAAKAEAAEMRAYFARKGYLVTLTGERV